MAGSADNKVEVDYAPTRSIYNVDIPYGNFILRLSVAQRTETQALVHENIKVLKKNLGSEAYTDVTKDLITMFREDLQLKVTGDNVMKMCAIIFNEVERK